MKLRFVNRYQKILIIILALYCFYVGIRNPAFLNISTLLDLIRTSSTMLIVAMGLLFVMISGGIDVSFMAIALFGSYTSISIMIAFNIDNLAFAFVVAIAIGGVLGLINALLINWLKLPPFIITLGTLNLYHGVMTTFVGDKSFGAGVLPTCLRDFGQATIFGYQTGGTTYGLTVSFIPVLLIGLLSWFILNKTMVGRAVVAIGNDPESAVRVGFHPPRVRLFVYAYSGILAGIMGIIYVAQINALYPNKLVGDELMVIAAAVIGGTKITGGQGGVFGVVLGVAIISLLKSTLILIGLSSSWNDLFIGIILVASIAVSSYQERVRNRNHLIFTE